MRARAVYTPLRRQRDFKRIFAQGARKGDALIQVRVLRRSSELSTEAPIRLGITVSKKYGSAVERNRFKRIVRAAIRELGPEFTPGWDILVLPREVHEARTPQLVNSLRKMLGEFGVLRREEEGGAE